MADSTETRALLLTINATTELLRSQLTAAEKATADFQTATQRHLDGVDSRFEGLGKSLEKLEGPLERLKGLGEIAFGAFLGEGLVETGKKALEFAGNIQFVAEQAKVGTDFLQQFQYAAGQFGVDKSGANEALVKFARTVGEVANGNRGLTDTFERLGVHARDSGGNVRSVEAIFHDVVEGIKKFDAPAQATADTLQLMGKSAGGMVPLMSQGAEGFRNLAAAADSLGVVLSPELIAHSEEVNHKLSALKDIVDAQMAANIANNATSILQIASAMERAAVAVTKFIGSHPDIATGLLAGLATRLVTGGGVVGTIISAGVALATASQVNQNRPEAVRQRIGALNQLMSGPTAPPKDSTAYRNFADQRRKLQAQLAAFPKDQGLPEKEDLGSNKPGGTNSNTSDLLKAANADLASLEKRKAGASGAALAAYNEEIAAKRREIGFIKQGADAQLAGSLASKQGSIEKAGETAATRAARKAAEEEQRRRQNLAAFLRDEAAAESENAAARAELANTVQDRLKIEEDRLDTARKAKDAEIAAQGPKESGGTGKYTAAEVTRLQYLNDDTASLKDIALKRRAAAQIVDQQFASEQAQIGAQTALLQISDSLATTRKQRLEIEQQLLEAAQQLRRDEIAKAIKNAPNDPEAAKNALIAAQNLPQVEAAERAQLGRQNESPLEAYKTQLKGAVGDVNDALQGVEVDGLKGLEDGLTGVITGTESVAKAFKSMAASIISDLVRIGIEKSILGALGGGSGGGGGILGFLGLGGRGGLPTNNAGASDLGDILGFAGGGDPPVGKISLVGENGPELFLPKSAGTIIPNSALRAPSASLQGMNDNRTQVVIHVQANDYFDARVAGISGNQVQSAAPIIAAGGAELAGRNAVRARRRSLG